MLYRMLPLMLGLAFMTAHADTSTAEQKRLQGYGWTLYNDLFTGDDAYLYSPVSDSPDRRLEMATTYYWSDIETGGGRSPVWQDPERGLVNAIASYLYRDSEQIYRLGAEGEWYHGALTAIGRAGYVHGRGEPGYLYSGDAFESRPFAGLDLRWYATDNLSFQIGGQQLNDATVGQIRLEYQPGFNSMNGLSFFARASGGDHDSQYVLGGFRYSFGEAPSLLLRDRGDPAATAADRLSPYFRSLHNGRY